MCSKLVFLCLLYGFFIKVALLNPITPPEEILHLNSRLIYYQKRFDLIRKDLESKYTDDMESLMQHFESALASNDLAAKGTLVEHYPALLASDFNTYLQLQLDEQYLNEEIRLEEWYLQQLMPYLNDKLAAELADLLPQYEEALRMTQLDKKYETFTAIEDNFSEELLELLDANPEPKAMLNVHLQFFCEFLQYLLLECVVDEYEAKIKNLLTHVEFALSGENAVEKLKILDRFDDLDDKFGRFLSYKINEFEFDRFGK